MLSANAVVFGAAVAVAQFVPPPEPVLLTAAKSGVLPVLPPAFTGVQTLEGAIISKAPVNTSYTGVKGPAVVQSKLPAATYTATLPPVAFDALTGTTISGTVSGAAAQGGSGVDFTINLANLPDLAMYGPFAYHIHDMPVPADGNCTSTMGHLDTTNVGEYYTCDTSATQNCQTGDLAGKHGKIMSSPTFSTSFNEPYLSTDPSSPYFFGSKSVVIHTSNTTRLTCANFVQGGSSTIASAPMSTPSPLYTSSASKAFVGSAVMGVIAVAGIFML